MNNNEQKLIIGCSAMAVFPGDGDVKVPVKIDTGAQTSSIWASKLAMSDSGELSFCLFGSESPYFTGKVHTVNDYSVHIVRSSNGMAQIRYKVKLPIILEGKRINGAFTLSDRSKNEYPVLIGRSLLAGKFLVDVLKNRPRTAKHPRVNKGGEKLATELKKNPKEFFEKYHGDSLRGDSEL